MILVVCHDITGDGRREDVAALPSGYGPRVQLSVFECEVAGTEGAQQLRAALRERIDPLLDQVRIYPTTHATFSEGCILPWLRDRATTDDGFVRRAAVEVIAAGWAEDEGTLPWLRDRATTDCNEDVRRAALQAVRRIAPGLLQQ